MKTKIEIKKLDANAIIPKYGTNYAAGADLYALIDGSLTIEPGQSVLIHTGIAMAIPEGLVGLIFARSGMACKRGLAPANKVGVIDSDYRGEIIVALHNDSDEYRYIENGERIAQLVAIPYLPMDLYEVDELDETARGAGGFGSTGK